jgi:hypothetical protein
VTETTEAVQHSLALHHVQPHWPFNMDSPVLPPDLEREFFETAAMMYPQEIPTLLRVACRVLSWSIINLPRRFGMSANFAIQDRAVIIQSRIYG